MDFNDKDIKIKIDQNILDTYRKSNSEDSLTDIFLISEDTLNNDEIKPDFENTSSNSKNCNKIQDSENQKVFNEVVKVEEMPKSFNISVDEPSKTDEKLKNLFSILSISDEEENTPQLRERGPDRQKLNNFRQQNIYESCKKINERRRFLSGSTCKVSDNFNSVNVFNDAFSKTTGIGEISINTAKFNSESFSFGSSLEHGMKTADTSEIHSAKGDFFKNLFSHDICTFQSQNNDSFYEDTVVNTCSPNYSLSSGYESCSPEGTSCSPPNLLGHTNAAIIETVDEQEVLDSIVELESITKCPHNPIGLSESNLSDDNHVETITNFLKENQADASDCSNSLLKHQKGENNSFVLFGSEENLNYNSSDSINVKITSSTIPKERMINEFEELSKKVNCSSQKLEHNSLKNETVSKPHLKLKPIRARQPSENPARIELRNNLSYEKFYVAQDEVYKDWNKRKLNAKDKNLVKVIYVDENDKLFGKQSQSNLHKAVLNSELEKIFHLIECHKQMHVGPPCPEINIRDTHGKTALDYAIEKNLTIVVKYLKENQACPGIKI